MVDQSVLAEELLDEVEIGAGVRRLVELATGGEGGLPVDSAIEEAGEARVGVAGIDLA